MAIRTRSRIRSAAILLSAALLATAALSRQARALARESVAAYVAPSPHGRYAARLRLRAAAAAIPFTRHLSGASPAIPAWLEAADAALVQPQRVRPAFSVAGTLHAPSDAGTWRLRVRRGYRVMVTAEFTGGRLFLDLFDASSGARLASARDGTMRVDFDVDADRELILRAQSTIEGTGNYAISARADPSMTFPVQGRTPRAVQSRFGAPRDAGAREHEGIDIFAPRGTPVVAATNGWIGTSVTNRLGGNVVWVWDPFRRVSTYYAHLDRRFVSPGERVQAGEVVGYVGNTGNARGGPTHLHFGVYATDGSVDPLPYVCGSAC